MEFFLKGFFLTLSLIVAIGAQNAFIIKQGIMKNHIFVVSGICFICDVVLMGLGVFGVGEFLAKNRILNLLIASVGILFVLYYGFASLKSAFFAESHPKFSQSKSLSLKKTILLTLAVTLLNPHVYLDTVFVVGASALMFSFDEKIIFALSRKDHREFRWDELQNAKTNIFYPSSPAAWYFYFQDEKKTRKIAVTPPMAAAMNL